LSIFRSITTKEQRIAFRRDYELDFFYQLPGLARMRANACFQQGSLSLAFRIIPQNIPTIEELGLPMANGTANGQNYFDDGANSAIRMGLLANSAVVVMSLIQRLPGLISSA